MLDFCYSVQHYFSFLFLLKFSFANCFTEIFWVFLKYFFDIPFVGIFVAVGLKSRDFCLKILCRGIFEDLNKSSIQQSNSMISENNLHRTSHPERKSHLNPVALLFINSQIFNPKIESITSQQPKPKFIHFRIKFFWAINKK